MCETAYTSLYCNGKKAPAGSRCDLATDKCVSAADVEVTFSGEEEQKAENTTDQTGSSSIPYEIIGGAAGFLVLAAAFVMLRKKSIVSKNIGDVEAQVITANPAYAK